MLLYKVTPSPCSVLHINAPATSTKQRQKRLACPGSLAGVLALCCVEGHICGHLVMKRSELESACESDICMCWLSRCSDRILNFGRPLWVRQHEATHEARGGVQWNEAFVLCQHGIHLWCAISSLAQHRAVPFLMPQPASWQARGMSDYLNEENKVD